jgi:FkbM family methyltransferase
MTRIARAASHVYGWYFRHGLQNRRGGWRVLEAMMRLQPVVPVAVDGHAPVWVDLRVANDESTDLVTRRAPYEEHLQRLFASLVSRSDTVVDVGANLGLHSVLLDELASRVLAFEPNPRLLPALRRTVAGLRNTELVECALADFDGTAHFDDQGDHSAGAIAPEGDVVNVRRLDDVLGGAPVHLMKIDVEGHEAAVLRGAESTLRACRPIIIYEQLRGTGPTAHDYLETFGYSFRVITRSGEFRPWSMDELWCDVLAMPPGAPLPGSPDLGTLA